MAKTALLFIVVYAMFVADLHSAKQQPNLNAGPDSQCLECMCQASTGCKDVGCHNAGPGKYYCGQFQISYAYWTDAGKPGADPGNPLDFELCLNDRKCSEETIKGYMKRYRKDCDNNNEIDCYDYARIHNVGPYGCNGTYATTTDFWKAFSRCY